MKNIITKSAVILLITSSFFSCKKEKQESPAVEQQATEILKNGVVETTQKGSNGNVVVFSNWITKKQSDWTGFGGMEISTDFITSSLSNSIKNNGIVLMYHQVNNVARQIPYVNLADDIVLDYSFITGKMTVKFHYTGSGVIGGIQDQQFRYVLISSSAISSNGWGRMAQPIDYSDYNAVCEYYGIPK